MADIVELIESATDDGLSEDEVLREIDDLISKKVDTNHVTSDLRTPLTSAIAHKFPKVVSRLAASGATFQSNTTAQRTKKVPAKEIITIGFNVWPFTSNEEGLLGFLIIAGVVAIASVFQLTTRSYPAILAGAIWLGILFAGKPWSLSLTRLLLSPFSQSQNPKSPSVVSSVNGYPGRLVVFEGLEGSYRTSMINKIRAHLEDELHLSVVLADGQATKIHRYPEPTRELKSKIMSLLQSLKRNGKKPKDTNVPLADLAPLAILEADILNIASTIMNTIEPALQRGQIVLCDKYIYSVFVRNFLRKSKSDAMVSALSFAIKPDLVLLFDKSPDAATAQVLSSKLQQEYLKKCIEYCKIPESKLITDNAFLEDEFGVPITYYDAGLDLHLAPEGIEAFAEFQRKSAPVFSQLKDKYNFTVILDADKSKNRTDSHVFHDTLKSLTSAVEPASDFVIRRPFLYRFGAPLVLIASFALTCVAVISAAAQFQL